MFYNVYVTTKIEAIKIKDLILKYLYLEKQLMEKYLLTSKSYLSLDEVIGF